MNLARFLGGIVLVLNLALCVLYLQYLPYVPFKHDYERKMTHLNETEVIQTLDLDTGLVKTPGWMRFPNNVVYNHELISSFAKLFGRIKFFNYFYVRDENYLVTMAHCNFGLLSFAFVNIRDIRDYSKPIIEIKIDDHFHQYVSINVDEVGRYIKSAINHPSFNMTFNKKARDDHADIEISANLNSKVLSGRFKANMGGLEGITGIMQNQQDKTKHTLNTKIPLIRFEGSLSYNGESILNCEGSQPCLGLHDNSRAHASYVGRWIWPTTVFRDENNNSVGINLGHTHDDSNSAFDSVFVNGKMYKLDAHIMREVNEGLYVWDKHPNLNEHSEATLQLEFKREAIHKLGNNFIFANACLTSSYGKFSGRITTKDGMDIRFKDKFGFYEDMHALW